MKRVLASAVLALLTHGFFLAMPADLLRKRLTDVRETEAVTLTLAYYRPKKEQTGPKSPAPLKILKKQGLAFKPKPKKKVLIKPSAKKLPLLVVKKKAAPLKILKKQRPASKPKPKKKVLIKPPTKKIQRLVVKKKETPSKVVTEWEGPSEEAVEQEQQEVETKNEPKEMPPPAAHSVALKGPARTSLRQAIPIYRENPPPPYPSVARRRGYEGTTILEVLVNSEGGVDDVRISSSCGYSVLDRAAKSSVRKWVFIPALRDNKKVEMWVKIPIRFQLRKKQ